MKHEISFVLNDKENERANAFMEKHRHGEVDKGTIGGHMTFIFVPNSLRFSVVIRCKVCGEFENITDYDCW